MTTKIIVCTNFTDHFRCHRFQVCSWSEPQLLICEALRFFVCLVVAVKPWLARTMVHMIYISSLMIHNTRYCMIACNSWYHVCGNGWSVTSLRIKMLASREIMYVYVSINLHLYTQMRLYTLVVYVYTPLICTHPPEGLCLKQSLAASDVDLLCFCLFLVWFQT